MQLLLSRARKCIEDYNMISPGDRVAVGLSGGKDSTATLWALSQLRRFYPVPFQVEAITIDLGFPGVSFDAEAAMCADLGVEYTIVKSQIAEIVFDIREESSPCSLCAKLRRGALSTALQERGISKLAYGHHLDDAIETLMMNLIFEGRIGAFRPVTFLDRTGVTVIRPLLYCEEDMTEKASKSLGLPVAGRCCPADGHTKREEVKQLIKTLEITYPDLKEKLFGAIKRYPLAGWER